MNNPLMLTVQDFATGLGTTSEQIPKQLQNLIRYYDFRYESLTAAEREQEILRVLKRIDSGDLTQVGAHRKNIWEKGWEENLNAFAAKQFAPDTLIPRFLRPEPIVRWRGEFVRSLNPRFEFYYHDVLRQWLFLRYMTEAETIYEFGSGSGYNLVALAELQPRMRFVGLDWAESAVNLINQVGQIHRLNLTGRKFDFFHPDESVPIGSRDVAFTIAALEQVGSRHEEFLQFLLRKRPRLVIHMEPVLELYDASRLVDYLAIQFHSKRHYLSGFLPRLRQLEAERRVEILHVRRTGFGSLFHETYNHIIWKPL